MTRIFFYEVVPDYTDRPDEELDQSIMDAGFGHRVNVELKIGQGGLRKIANEHDRELGEWTYYGDGRRGNYFFTRLEDAIWARLVL